MGPGTSDPKKWLTLEEAYELIRRRAQSAIATAGPAEARPASPASVDTAQGASVGFQEFIGGITPMRPAPSGVSTVGDPAAKTGPAGRGSTDQSVTARARELANQTILDADALAHKIGGGDPESVRALLHNGPVDAWRHAEWSRRMAQEFGPVIAYMIGLGHEVVDNGGAYLAGNLPGNPSLGRFISEGLMDLRNNRLGVFHGATPVDPNDPRLYYGSGGVAGYPPASRYVWPGR